MTDRHSPTDPQSEGKPPTSKHSVTAAASVHKGYFFLHRVSPQHPRGHVRRRLEAN